MGAWADVGTASGKNSKKCPHSLQLRVYPNTFPKSTSSSRCHIYLRPPQFGLWVTAAGWGAVPGPPSTLGVACTQGRVFVPGLSGSKSSIWGALGAPCWSPAAQQFRTRPHLGKGLAEVLKVKRGARLALTPDVGSLKEKCGHETRGHRAKTAPAARSPDAALLTPWSGLPDPGP